MHRRHSCWTPPHLRATQPALLPRGTSAETTLCLILKELTGADMQLTWMARISCSTLAVHLIPSHFPPHPRLSPRLPLFHRGSAEKICCSGTRPTPRALKTLTLRPRALKPHPSARFSQTVCCSAFGCVAARRCCRRRPASSASCLYVSPAPAHGRRLPLPVSGGPHNARVRAQQAVE
jgi:hypothetical protein